jgi:transmembrane sensor
MSLPEDLRAADEEAALWLFRQDAGMSDAHEAALTAWRGASPENEAAWVRLAAAWDSVVSVDQPLIDAMRIDALTARPAYAAPVRRFAFAAAAVICLILIGLGGWTALRPRISPGSVEIAANAPPTYIAGDAVKMVTLADGSRATLSQGSELAVRFSNGSRDLRLLRGESVFDVVHDGRPFTVAVGDVAVTATGTRFDVRLTSGQVTATLERGAVVIRRKGEADAVLAPGQMLVAAQGKPMVVSDVDAPAALAWTTGFFEFHDTPLDQAAAQVVRGTSVRIKVMGAAARLKVSGRFRSGDPRGFLAAITQVLPVRQRRGADGVTELLMR